MRNELRTLVALSGLFLCTTAFADSTADKLMQIEAETMILKAKEKQLDVQSKIVSRQLEIAEKQSESERMVQPSRAGNPVVHSIEGLGNTMYATLQLQGGALIDVQAGDVLENGMKVLAIRPNEVVVQTRKKQPVRLALQPVAPATYSPNYSGAQVRLPLPPPAMLPPREMQR